jgi:hypothetical protein
MSEKRKPMKPVKGWIVAARGPFFHVADASDDWHVRVYRRKGDAAVQFIGTSYRLVRVEVRELERTR